MTPENMLSGTAAYQLEYSSRSPAVSPAPSAPEDLLSLREAVEDPQLWMQSRHAAIEERIERLRLIRGRLQTEVAERDRYRHEWASANAGDETAEYCPYHVDEDGATTAIGVSAPTPPPFTITTESGQEESDENDAMPSAAVMDDRRRRESRWRPESDDEEEGHDLRYRFPPLRRSNALDLLDSSGDRRWRSQRSFNPIRRAAPLRAPSRIEPKESETESESLIAPHARFFIARHKNKITIKFHPAMLVATTNVREASS